MLTKNNIQYGIHYPISINKLDCFKNIFKGENFKSITSIGNNPTFNDALTGFTYNKSDPDVEKFIKEYIIT